MCRPLFVALFLMLFGARTIIQAQQANIYAVFPVENQTNVGTDASIVLRAIMPIIPPSVTASYPDANDLGYTAHRPTITLISEAESRDTDPSKWYRKTIYGKYEFADVRTVRFKPFGLLADTRYRCIVSDIFLQSPNGPIPASKLDFYFTTTSLVPQIETCSLDSFRVFTCTQPINFQFSGATLTPADIVRALRVEQTSPMDNQNWQPADVQLIPNPIQNALSILPLHSWEVGKSIHVVLDLSIVTGNPLDRKEWMVPVRNAGKVVVTAVSADGREVPEYISEQLSSNNVVTTNTEPLTLSCPEDLGNRWQFVRWESPAFQQSISTAFAHVTISCELLMAEIPIYAIIERIDTITTQISVNGKGAVQVYSGEGRLIKTIEQKDTLYITDDYPEYRLMAIPASGSTLTSWSATQGGNNGNPAATIIVNAQTMFGPNALSVQLQLNTANFGPVIPLTPYENFRLRGQLSDVDADKLFDINDAVGFTTEKNYEDVQTGKRALCVKAQPCWEIIGYSVSATGKSMNFDLGVGEYCVEADMTNPENVVTFFGRRKQIALRIDRVLLASDDPNDIAKDQVPHPESKITVQKKVQLSSGATSWKTYNQYSCRDKNIAFGGQMFQCGDELRLLCSGSTLRGEVWKYFSQPVNYVIPDGGGKQGTESIYSLVVQTQLAKFTMSSCNGADEDIPEIRVRGCFEQQFGIESIALRVRIKNGEDRANSFFTERWLDPAIYYDELADEPRSGRHLQYIPRRGTHVKVKFTAPIDVRTIIEGGMTAESVNNILVTDPALRGLDFKVESFDGAHINYYPADGSPITTVEFAICDPRTSPRLQALHFGNFELTCLRSIKSLTGKPLLTKSTFALATMELPGVGYHLKSINYAYDGDLDFILPNYGETYQVVYGANLAVEKAHHTDIGFKRIPDCREQQGTPVEECTIPHSDKNGPQEYSEKLLWVEPYWMDYKDLAYIHIVSYDEDCKDKNDCLVNNVYDLLDEVRERVESYQVEDKKGEVDWRTVLPDVIALGSRLIQGLLPIDEQDEYLGEGTHLAGAGNGWGVITSTAPYITLKHPNTTYTLIGKLYVSRMVVR
ncbi:MAG: hypothetical protein HQ472_08765 [Ignavibacteria bacterium]|nr:hypothetical protein [Ignavibacteria bacterium]